MWKELRVSDWVAWVDVAEVLAYRRSSSYEEQSSALTYTFRSQSELSQINKALSWLKYDLKLVVNIYEVGFVKRVLYKVKSGKADFSLD
jgi:hypothetical protein